jgi:hypothetical protein
VIYAKLTKGAFPVKNANVVAKIFRPGGQKSSGVVSLTLRDNGSGDPDVTSGDGIYSAYFSEYTSVPGFYSVQVTADDNKGQARLKSHKIFFSWSLMLRAGNTKGGNITVLLTSCLTGLIGLFCK